MHRSMRKTRALTMNPLAAQLMVVNIYITLLLVYD